MPIHPTAVVDPTAQIDPTAAIGPATWIGARVSIGAECEVMHGARVGPFVRMGARNRVHFGAVIGHEPQYIGFARETQSWVEIGDGNEFREFCSVHRAIKPDAKTVIGNANFFMATSHVAHDCIIGNNVVMANFSGLAGHVEVGDRVFVSGPVGVHQFCRIGRLAMIGGFGGVSKDVPPFMTLKGTKGYLVGLNTVGLRRAGIGAEARRALRNAYRSLFRSGLSLPNACKTVRESFAAAAIPAEVAELLAFCEVKSKRGIHTGPRLDNGAHDEDDDSES